MKKVRGADDQLEPQLLQSSQRVSGVVAVGLDESLVKHHAAVRRGGQAAFAEAVAQRAAEDERDQLLPFPAAHPGHPVVHDRLPRAGRLNGAERDVLTGIEHASPPGLSCSRGVGQTFQALAQPLEGCLDLGLVVEQVLPKRVVPGEGQHDLPEFLQVAVGVVDRLDRQVGAVMPHLQHPPHRGVHPGLPVIDKVATGVIDQVTHRPLRQRWRPGPSRLQPVQTGQVEVVVHEPVHRAVADRGVVGDIRAHPRQPEGGHPLAGAG